jgi:A/G-specific adenine glycosylase
VSDFAERLLGWFDEHGRKDLPWQYPRDAYRIWVSEIMLQQTQVQTVIPYFERFIARFPDAVTLADAAQDDVLQRWSGLGYYARARNLHRAAQLIRDRHAGEFPRTLDEVMELPGVGRSTAGAILCLAFDQRHTILDGNVKRVLARHRAVDGWPGKAAVAKQLWEIAEEYTPGARTAAYTQAIMDLGATLCTSSKPGCERCPVAADCEALNRVTDTIGLGKKVSVTQFPGRKPKKTKPLRATTMVIAKYDGHVYLERRPEAGIWGGLWSLPEIGGGDVHDWCRETLQSGADEVETWQLLRHSFSHYDLDIQPIVVRVGAPLSKVADSDDATWHRLGDELPGGMAAPIHKLIERLTDVTHD